MRIATLETARALVAAGLDEHELLRATVIRAYAGAFARGYGMVPAGTLLHAPVADLDYASLTPEHFGHVHEILARTRIEDGQLIDEKHSTVHFTPRSLTEPIVRKTLEPLLAAMAPGASVLELRVCDPSCGAGAFLVEAARQLAQRLVDSGAETDVLVAKRLVAIHCLYGVDICPWAIASAKIAMWLECRATAMPPGWLDGNIKRGDALVGLMGDQVARFHWSPDGTTRKGERIPEVAKLRAAMDRAAEIGTAARRDEMAALAALARVA